MSSVGDKLRWHEAVLADPALTPSAARIAGWLMHRFNSRTLIAEIAGETIAEDLGMSESTCWRGIRELKEAGWVESSGGRFASRYRPLLHRVDEVHDRLANLRTVRRAKHQRPWTRGGECDTPTVIPDDSNLSPMTDISGGSILLDSHYSGLSKVAPQLDRQKEAALEIGPFPAIVERRAAEEQIYMLLGQGSRERGRLVAATIGSARTEFLIGRLQIGELFQSALSGAITCSASLVKNVTDQEEKRGLRSVSKSVKRTVKKVVKRSCEVEEGSATPIAVQKRSRLAHRCEEG